MGAWPTKAQVGHTYIAKSKAKLFITKLFWIASMPTIITFGKLKLQIFADDHNPPHFHAVNSDHEALLRLSDLTVLRGQISRRDYDTIKKWTSKKANKDLLIDAWDRLNQSY